MYFFAVLKAHFSFYGAFYKNYKKREKIQSKKYYQINSIVYKYYIKKEKIYKDLF